MMMNTSYTAVGGGLSKFGWGGCVYVYTHTYHVTLFAVGRRVLGSQRTPFARWGSVRRLNARASCCRTKCSPDRSSPVAMAAVLVSGSAGVIGFAVACAVRRSGRKVYGLIRKEVRCSAQRKQGEAQGVADANFFGSPKLTSCAPRRSFRSWATQCARRRMRLS